MEEITEPIEEKEHQISSEIIDIDEEVIDKSIQSGKPKRERTEKQKIAFEKARKTRAENVKKRAEDKKNNKKPVGRPKKEQEILTESDAIEKVQELVENGEMEVDVPESESEPEPEIVYKKKPKQIKKKVVKKKKKPKKKVVYISDSESSSESESESDEEVIVKQITKKKNKKVYYEDEPEYQEIQYNTYKPPSITDFYKVM
jgi:hypothetical protein